MDDDMMHAASTFHAMPHYRHAAANFKDILLCPSFEGKCRFKFLTYAPKDSLKMLPRISLWFRNIALHY